MRFESPVLVLAVSMTGEATLHYLLMFGIPSVTFYGNRTVMRYLHLQFCHPVMIVFMPPTNFRERSGCVAVSASCEDNSNRRKFTVAGFAVMQLSGVWQRCLLVSYALMPAKP